MRNQLNDQDLEQVVGGTVYINGNKMRMKLSYTNQVFDLQNCEDYEAMILATQIYGQYKHEGDLAYENAVKAAFEEKGWI